MCVPLYICGMITTVAMISMVLQIWIKINFARSDKHFCLHYKDFAFFSIQECRKYLFFLIFVSFIILTIIITFFFVTLHAYKKESILVKQTPYTTSTLNKISLLERIKNKTGLFELEIDNKSVVVHANYTYAASNLPNGVRYKKINDEFSNVTLDIHQLLDIQLKKNIGKTNDYRLIDHISLKPSNSQLLYINMIGLIVFLAFFSILFVFQLLNHFFIIFSLLSEFRNKCRKTYKHVEIALSSEETFLLHRIKFHIAENSYVFNGYFILNKAVRYITAEVYFDSFPYKNIIASKDLKDTYLNPIILWFENELSKEMTKKQRLPFIMANWDRRQFS